jgi:hypothetical protein
MIRTRIRIDLAPWIRIRTDTNVDPKHCSKVHLNVYETFGTVPYLNYLYLYWVLLSVIEITIAVMQLIRSQIMQCQVRPDVCGGGLSLSPSVISQTPLITPTHIRLGPQHF